MLRITHHSPLPGTQQFLGVTFSDGVAKLPELHPEHEKALLQHGFSVTLEPVVDHIADGVEFEPLPPAVEGDMKPKTSRPRKRP